MTLKTVFVLALLGGAFASAQGKSFEACLPPEINLDMIVRTAPTHAAKEATKTTVKMRLVQLKARCQKGKLIDGKGRKIRFYTLLGCWGNPPEDYLELLQNQTEEIKRLEKRFRVIQIPCEQGRDPRMISLMLRRPKR